MSMTLIDFESAREKEKKREWEREARKAVLEKAKSKYEAQEQKEARARERGEHTWMLPSVEAKLHSSKMKKKKKKKEKKKQKKKKEKKSKKKASSSSSSSSESEEDNMWVEKSTPDTIEGPQKAKNVTQIPSDSSHQLQDISQPSKRDGWMEMTSLFATYTREEQRVRDGTSRKKMKEEEQKRKREADKPGSHARELNPYYKDGGSGLPEEKSNSSTPAGAAASSGLDATWLRKALQRAKEQAKAENKSLEEIAAQRWGSLATFNQLLADAEGREKKGNDEDRMERQRRPEGKYYRREDWRGSVERLDGSRRGESQRSQERGINTIHHRRRSRSKSRSRERKIANKRRRSRSRSRSRDRKVGNKRRSRSGSREVRHRRNRSGSDSSSGSRSRSRSKRRNDGNRRKDERQERRRYSSSNSSSGSSSSRSRSRSRSRRRETDRCDDHRHKEKHEESRRSVQILMKPPDDEDKHSQKPSALASRFQRPGESSDRRQSVKGWRKGSPPRNQGWRKKEFKSTTESRKERKTSSSSSSSSSSTEAEEEVAVSAKSSSNANVDNHMVSSAGTLASSSVPECSPSAPDVLLTDTEMNELAAKIMKAELSGNDARASKLKEKLESARASRAAATADSLRKNESGGVTEQLVVLSRMDAKGISRPVIGYDQETDRSKKRKKVKTHGQDGKRNKYFPDDDAHDLKRMFEMEKGTSAEDQNSMFEQALLRNSEKLNDDYDVDDMFMSKTVLKETSAKQAEREKQKAIEEHRRSERSLESCQWCFDNKVMPKHLIVALGTKSYVCLPPHESLTPGHCLIVPIHHVACAVQADEDLWSEVQSFRKSLVRMFSSREEDCIFFESVKRLRNYPHMVIQCVPLPKEIGDMAPIYFKKAIMECETEWAQNKKLVDLKNRNVRTAVPKGLPYFFVDFAMDSGYAHVIEDEQEFPHNFAQEIVGGMLDLDNNLWRKPRKENFDNQRKKVMEFSKWFKEFDPTEEQQQD